MDSELRAIERVDWRDPRALRARVRTGEAHACIFCGHACTGEPQCEFRRESRLEIPEVLKPAPCGCDHTDIPLERTRQDYETVHGVDVNLAKRLAPFAILYDVRQSNRDGSPLRWRVNGRCKLWKRSPRKFRLPIKHGMYDYSYVDEQDAVCYRTQEEWAR